MCALAGRLATPAEAEEASCAALSLAPDRTLASSYGKDHRPSHLPSRPINKKLIHKAQISPPQAFCFSSSSSSSSSAFALASSLSTLILAFTTLLHLVKYLSNTTSTNNLHDAVLRRPPRSHCWPRLCSERRSVQAFPPRTLLR